jgi:hypothetical protein
LASPPGSLLNELRTPFFPVLEMSEEEAAQFVGRFGYVLIRRFKFRLCWHCFPLVFLCSALQQVQGRLM